MSKPLPAMFPVKFPEANRNLTNPEDEEHSLLVFTDGNECVSCWKVPWMVRLSILFHGVVWLSVLSGSTQPPVWLSGEKTVFVKEASDGKS